ncbi:IclR family transcriptional regulator [Xanthobacter tagetidis]|uniref:IclR family transcriptional regulator n=1 Tax=Xanthobacter tagetidis TaxID=60216 RepID=A0A3L7A6B3_9HYPH|nr:IclR family transcriptional regulator [Xanthobacter tagetidis]MBB6308853.1 DNA-binding IclR family transcriptional regulator [Xanthobacter tagetidis]RLP74902.1 IclR family transcriptional regulator [Xanthobacter tagetidis]
MEKTVVKAFELLETLAGMDKPTGITALAQELGLTKSNVFRLLNTMARRGYVRRHEDAGQYELTLKVWHLGMMVLSRLDVKKAAAAHIEDLMRTTTESVHLSILVGGEVTYIEKIESEQAVRAYSRVGDRPPAHCVATGKVLLAYLPEEALEKRLEQGLAKYTTRTITNARVLRKELEAIRKRGFSENRGEWRESVCGVAAPIRDWSGQVVAAVGISGPAERLKPDTLERFAPPVIACAETISRELGYLPSAPEPLPLPEPKKRAPRKAPAAKAATKAAAK